MGKRAKTFAIGTVFAAAAGFVAGILTAPKSGKETRQDIADASHHAVTEAEKTLKHLHSELLTQFEIATTRADELKGQASKRAHDIATTAEDAKLKAQEALDAFRNGKSDDADLQKAIKEAEKAIKHVREFLKK